MLCLFCLLCLIQAIFVFYLGCTEMRKKRAVVKTTLPWPFAAPFHICFINNGLHVCVCVCVCLCLCVYSFYTVSVIPCKAFWLGSVFLSNRCGFPYITLLFLTLCDFSSPPLVSSSCKLAWLEVQANAILPLLIIVEAIVCNPGADLCSCVTSTHMYRPVSVCVVGCLAGRDLGYASRMPISK